MTRRRTSNTRRGRQGRAGASASERWLLLVFVVAGVVIVVGAMGSWSVQPPSPDAARPLTMAQARTSNAAVSIERRSRIRAAPYRFRGGAAKREQAAECLATAALYEAGEDPAGQRAVIQVVLNRVRAAGFPKTVCGVVYQGFARTTGCQFSFTCDGSVARRPVRRGWAAARRAARRALAGRVDAAVGQATHYHADWMVPYWRDSLTKIARVGDHLFYVRPRRRSESGRSGSPRIASRG